MPGASVVPDQDVIFLHLPGDRVQHTARSGTLARNMPVRYNARGAIVVSLLQTMLAMPQDDLLEAWQACQVNAQ